MPFQQTEEGCRVEGVGRWEVEAAGLRIGLQVTRPRAFPWLRVVRVPRFGRGLDPEAVDPILERLVELAKERPVLRMHVEIWSERERERAVVANACEARRFSLSPSRSYKDTIWLDISAPEQELFLSFHRKARRDVRAPKKKGLPVLPVTDPVAVPRVNDIFRSTFHRTGGTPPEVDWEVLIRTNDKPGSAHHIVGLFSSADPAKSKLLAFAVAYLHGDVVEFAHAGSARDPDFRIPLLYAPTWELMLWARSKGARFWDFGGIVPVPSDSGHPLTGINDFKRYFSQKVVEVGGEWVLGPNPLLSTLRRTRARLR